VGITTTALSCKAVATSLVSPVLTVSQYLWCTMQWTERVDIHIHAKLHCLATEKHREASYWPKNGLRSNLIAPKFQNVSGGAWNGYKLDHGVVLKNSSTSVHTSKQIGGTEAEP